MKVMILLAFLSVYINSSELLVFSTQSTPVKIQRELENKLSSQIEVTSFAKIRDLLKNVLKDSVFFIAPAFSTQKTKSLKQLLISKNQKHQKYHLVTNNHILKLKDVANFTIGLTRFLPKRDLKKFVNSIDKLEAVTHFKYSSKIDNLKGLLGLEIVDALLLTDSQYEELKIISALPYNVLHVSPKKYNFNLGLYTLSNQYSKKDLKVLSKTSIDALGIKFWEGNP